MSLSVLMAVYNNEKTLRQAVDSILSQTFKDFIFYIVDDCSTDESPRILTLLAGEDKRIKLTTNQRHLGLTKSLNKGLKQIKATYIARMDADDLALTTRLQKQLDYLQSHPKISLLGTAAYLIDADGKKLGLKRHPLDQIHIRQNILHYCPFIHPTWMIKREVFLETGNYREDFIFSQDYELALRIVSQYQTANLSEPLIYYRVDAASAISLKNLKVQEKLAIKARFLALTNYGYPVSEAWKLIKPLLSFLVPVGIKRLMYRKFFWSGCLTFSLLLLSGCQKTVPLASPQPSLVSTDSAINVNVSRAADYNNWKYYSNNTYRYKLRHPFNWYFIDQIKEPVTVTLSSVPQEKLPTPYAACQVIAAKNKGKALDDFSAVVELRQKGRESRQMTIAKSPALFFGGLGPDGDLFSVFLTHKDSVFQLNWDGNHKVTRDEFKNICLQIMASLEFF